MRNPSARSNVRDDPKTQTRQVAAALRVHARVQVQVVRSAAESAPAFPNVPAAVVIHSPRTPLRFPCPLHRNTLISDSSDCSFEESLSRTIVLQRSCSRAQFTLSRQTAVAPGCGTVGDANRQQNGRDRITAAVKDPSQASLRQMDRDMASQMLAGPGVGRILPLSSEAIAQIHSSKHITNISGVVLSLVENSLDAQASNIDVVVDFNRGGCMIDDNGIGIPPAEFQDDGGLAKMYFSSKRDHNGSNPTAISHGSHGVFLAQLSALSLLMITSKRPNGDAVLKVHHGQVLLRKIPQHPSSHEDLSSCGTSVEVRDLFGNMPVRIKQRAIAAERADNSDKTWQSLKHDIIGLLLAWPYPCRISIRDTREPNRRCTVSAHHPAISAALTSKSLDQLAGRPRKFDLQDVLPILFQAGIAPLNTRQRWIPLSATSGVVALKGVICLDPAPSKQCQFIAVGIQPSLAENGRNVLYDCVNKAFANSSFGHIDDEGYQAGPSSVSPYKAPRGRRSGLVSDRKGVDRFAMFCLQLNFKAESSSLAAKFSRPTESSLTALVGVLEAAVEKWLAVNHFGPRNRKRKRNGQQGGPSPTITPKKGGFVSTHPDDTSPSSRRIEAIESSGLDAMHQTARKPHLGSSITFSGIGETSVGSFTHRLLDLSNLSAVRSGTATRIINHKNGWLPPGGNPEHIIFGDIKQPTLYGQDNPCAMPSDMSPKSQTRNLKTVLPFASRNTHPSSDNFGSIDEEAMLTVAADEMAHAEECSEIASSAEDDLLDWMDPASGRVHKVNARTGLVAPSPANNHAGERSAASSLSLTRRLPEFLQQWYNPVFMQQKEVPIRVMQHAGPVIPEVDVDARCFAKDNDYHRCRPGDYSQGSKAKLSKKALSQAKVIGQVDRKFILCEIPRLQGVDAQDVHRGGETMVLVDQHAASERIILEGLLQDICSPMGEVVPAPGAENVMARRMKSVDIRAYTNNSKPLIFEVSDKERELLARYGGHFNYWGIAYDFSNAHFVSTEMGERRDSQGRQHLLRIKTLPPTIAQRCATLPEVCISMIRAEIWALDDGTRRPVNLHDVMTNQTAESAGISIAERSAWLQSIPKCPQGILDMLNSRACRSAIMFNDPLSRADCEALVGRLASCVFPFICAHGRISVVPLADMDNFGDYHEWE